MKAEKVKNYNTNLPFLAVFNVYININCLRSFVTPWTPFHVRFPCALDVYGFADLLDFLDLVFQTFKITTNESQTLYCFWFPQPLIHLLAQSRRRAAALNNASNVFDVTCVNKSD